MLQNNSLLGDRRWMTLMLTVLLLGTSWIFVSRVPTEATTDGAPPPSPREGFSAPDFTLELLDGGQVTLSHLRGSVVMVNFWATWCLPCREEMPTIESVYQIYKDQGLEVLAINSTFQDSIAEVESFITQHNLSFPIPLDNKGAVSDRYQLRGLPSTYFIDRQGVIRSLVIGGPMNEAVMRTKIQDLIEETP